MGPEEARLRLTQLADIAINSQGEPKIEVGKEKGEGPDLGSQWRGEKARGLTPEEENKAPS